MAKEIKCETYRQRCEFLGKDAQVFDMLLSHNGILVPAPIVKTILVEWEQYKKDGDLHLSEMARIRKESYDAYHEVLGDVRSAIVQCIFYLRRDYAYNASMSVHDDAFLDEFEAEMLKLWEEKK